MFNLMRMDLKRLQKSRSTYIIGGIIVLILLIQFLAVYVALNPEIQDWLSARGFVFQISGMDQLQSLSLIQFFHLSMTQNFYLFVIGIFVVLFNCYERETGFIKNILSIHVNKTHYVLSKIITQSLYVLGLILICFIEFLILNLFVGSFFTVNPFIDSLTYLIFLWVIGIAIISMFTTLSIWLKSKSGCISIAIVYATGLWLMIATTILNIFGWNDLLNYTLFYQSNGLLEFMSSLDFHSVFKLLSIVGIWIITYISLSIYGLKNRDI